MDIGVAKEVINKLSDNNNSTARIIVKELRKYNQMLSIDIELAILCSRKALDIMLRSACEMIELKVGTKPLESIISDLSRSGYIPNIIEKHCRIIKDFGNVAAHGLSSDDYLEDQDSDFTEIEAEICSRALNSVVIWYISKILPKVLDIFPFEVIHGKEIEEYRIKQAVDIDEKSYSDEYKGVLELCLAWFKQNPEIYTLIIDKRIDKVVGYINALPLEEEIIRKIQDGVFMDTDIKPENILTYDFPDFYKLYLCSVVIDPDYRGTIAFKMLYEAYFDKLLNLARNDVYVSEIIADAVTKDGEKLCNFIGMKKINDTTHGSLIYKTTLLPPSIRVTTRKAKNIALLYQKKYEEFKELLDINENV